MGSLRELLGGEPIRVPHHLTTELHDDFVPYIDQLEDRLGAGERSMVAEPRDEYLAEISSIRERADSLRRTLTPGRGLAARSLVETALLDIGTCLGGPVSDDYYDRAPFPFDGKIDTVTVRYSS